MPRINQNIALFLLALLISLPAGSVTLEELYERPKISSLKISPTGDYLAMRFFEDGKHSVLFMDRATQELLGSVQHHGKNEIGSFYWANHERVVAQVYAIGDGHEAPRNYGELVAGNFDGSRTEIIFGYRAGEAQVGSVLRKKDVDKAWGSVIDPLPENKEEILISSQTWSASFGRPPAAEMLNVYTGHSGERIHSAKFSGATFLTDSDGVVRLVSGMDENLKVYAEALPAGALEWIDLDTGQFGSSFRPVAVSDDGQSAFVLANVDNDKLGLYRLALDGSEFKLLYVNDKVDITSVNLTPDGRSVYAMRIDKNFPSYLLLSKTHEEAIVFKSLLQLFPGHAVEITSDSEDGRFWIVNTSSDVDPGSYFLLDREENTLIPLFKSLPDIDVNELAKVEPIEFESFDGLGITGYFTPAKDSGGAVAPMVVLVHGGPRLRDYWQYDPDVQALATRGFSVLQINFRGSDGFGDQFMHAGDRHWGDHVQQDIIAGTRWAIANGRAEQGSICIMGTSFGAYSAVQSATLEPDLYACAVANAGIYDLEMLYTDGDIEDLYYGDAFLDEIIGRDEELLRKFSPVHNAASLKAPLFIAHGKLDDRAPYKHAKRLMKTLDDHDKKYDSYIIGRESHGFYDTTNQVEYMEKVLKFLKKHLK